MLAHVDIVFMEFRFLFLSTKCCKSDKMLQVRTSGDREGWFSSMSGSTTGVGHAIGAGPEVHGSGTSTGSEYKISSFSSASSWSTSSTSFSALD